MPRLIQYKTLVRTKCKVPPALSPFSSDKIEPFCPDINNFIHRVFLEVSPHESFFCVAGCITTQEKRRQTLCSDRRLCIIQTVTWFSVAYNWKVYFLVASWIILTNRTCLTEFKGCSLGSRWACFLIRVRTVYLKKKQLFCTKIHFKNIHLLK